MPPQLTDISPGIEGEAARRGLNLSIVQAKGAIDQALAARLKASAKALDKGVAEPAAPGILGLLKRAWLAFLERRQNLQITLQDLSDRELLDIGLTRGEIEHLTPERSIDTVRDNVRYLWGRGGM